MRSCFSRMPFPVTVIVGKTEANLRRCSSASLGIHVLPDLMIERRAERVLSLLVCSAIVAKLRLSIMGVVWRMCKRLFNSSGSFC